MNERFKELAVQSDLWRMLEEYSWEFGSCDPEKDCGRIEKFAELIVQECMSLCRECIDDGCIEAEEPMRKIKQHFRVE